MPEQHRRNARRQRAYRSAAHTPWYVPPGKKWPHPDVLCTLPVIARYMGRSPLTIRRWWQRHGFPIAVGPDGRWITTRGLIHQWISVRSMAQRAQDKEGSKHMAKETYNTQAFAPSDLENVPGADQTAPLDEAAELAAWDQQTNHQGDKLPEAPNQRSTS